jgi:hypothetical protein
MFSISIYLPRINKTANLKEFTNKNYFELAKFYYADDNRGISLFFDNIVKELLVNKEIFSELTCIEKFFILLNLYNYCLYDTISLYSKPLNSSVRVPITSVIEALEDINFIEEKNILLEDITITLNAPATLYNDNIDKVIDSSIYSITSNKEIFYYNNFTEKEKNLFLASLPSYFFDEIIDYYKKIGERIFNALPSGSTFAGDSINISLIDGTMFNLLKSIFNIDLRTYYENLLVSTKQLNIDSNLFFSLTYKDFLSLYKIYEESMKQNGENNLNIPSM